MRVVGSITKMSTYFPPSLSLKSVFVAAVVVRVALIVYSEWHDAHSAVKYTDVDYRVFTDAAAFVARPGGDNTASGPLAQYLPLPIGDPYKRETYRYTPLLALLLTPNIWLHPSFGKYLFAFCDLVNGLLTYKILKRHILPRDGASVDAKEGSTTPSNERQAVLLTAGHLLNPLVFSISTRGSSESVLVTFVLLTLYASLNGQWKSSAILLGLSTHWKIYPLVYGISCLQVIGNMSGAKGFWGSLSSRRSIGFALLSASTFGALGVLCYAIWGYPFLFESYLYHLHRLDHRHNFSPYFYATYLTYPSVASQAPLPVGLPDRILRSSLTSFVPQIGLSLGLGLVFGKRQRDLVFTWFLQTATFVIFNKVCTSQYFLWYLTFVPLLIPDLTSTWNDVAIWVALWAGTQALWLSEAYRLEFLGKNSFYPLWLRGLLYVAGNTWVLTEIMSSYRRRS